MSILRFLGLDQTRAATAVETDTIRKITQELNALDPERAKYIAAFSYILSRVARADLNISPEETRTMERIIVELGRLSEEQAIIVIQMAKSQNILFGGTEDFLITREFNKMATYEQKLELLECLFAVSAADQSISTVEDNEISRIASELRIEHRDFIAVRSSFREHLAVLKEKPGPPMSKPS
jgi:uncharacterized tellurite resistance protein B-like protein